MVLLLFYGRSALDIVKVLLQCVVVTKLVYSKIIARCNFYTPVFRRDVLWYGDVRPSGSPSVRPGLRPSVRLSQFSALFSYML